MQQVSSTGNKPYSKKFWQQKALVVHDQFKVLFANTYPADLLCKATNLTTFSTDCCYWQYFV